MMIDELDYQNINIRDKLYSNNYGTNIDGNEICGREKKAIIVGNADDNVSRSKGNKKPASSSVLSQSFHSNS